MCTILCLYILSARVWNFYTNISTTWLFFQGSLHSGYPAMGYAGVDSKQMLDVKYLGEKGAWGVTHEIAHNIQWITGFYVDSYGETTNNFWSIYVSQKVS